MKKICFVTSSPFVANAFLPNHINALKKEFDVYIVVNFNDSLAELRLPQLEPNHSRHIQIERNIKIGSDMKAFLNLTRYFKEMRFDVVHSITPKAGLLAMMAAKFAGVKNRIHIFTGQVWLTKAGFSKKLLIFFDKMIVNFATYILIDGESQRNFLIQSNIVSASNSKVFGRGSICGVDTSRFFSDASVRHDLRKKLDLTDDDVVFCYLGRINKDKGILDLAKAFKIISSKYKNAKLLIAGSDEGNFIPQITDITGDNKSVILYGKVEKPEFVLQAADIFCLPSYREGFSISVIEASLMGLPVICSDTYGLTDTMIDNKTGLVHFVGDIDSLTDKMEKLLQYKQLRESFGKNGRQFVLDNFSAEDVSNHWLEFYRKNFKN